MATKSVTLPLLTAGALVAGVAAYALRRNARHSRKVSRAESRPAANAHSSGIFEAEALQASDILDVPAETGAELADIDLDVDELDASELRLIPPTATLSEQPLEAIESYDAITPEDLGTEWLSRATEAPPANANEPINAASEIPEQRNYAVSEASYQAARAPEENGGRERVLEEYDDIWKALDEPPRRRRPSSRPRRG